MDQPFNDTKLLDAFYATANNRGVNAAAQGYAPQAARQSANEFIAAHETPKGLAR